MNLTQAEMAEACNIHPNSQSGYETGSSWPTAEYLEKLVGLGGDVYYLFHGTYVNPDISEPVAELLALLVQLPPEMQATCYAMLTLFRRTSTSGQPGSVQADEIWRAVRLFEQYFKISNKERVLVETAADLNHAVLPRQ